jgi:methyl-accepting chemotaxis protein
MAWARNDTAPVDPGAARLRIRDAASDRVRLLRRMLRAVGLVAVGAALVAALAAWLLSRRMVRPIVALNAAVERIVRDGDLTQQIEVS